MTKLRVSIYRHCAHLVVLLAKDLGDEDLEHLAVRDRTSLHPSAGQTTQAVNTQETLMWEKGLAVPVCWAWKGLLPKSDNNNTH